jgi:glycosyltransferase involved in cell wall biosynthesis
MPIENLRSLADSEIGVKRYDRVVADSGTLPPVALLTGGGDKPYALGLAFILMSQGVAFDFIGSDDTDVPELHQRPLVRFLNLRGDQSPNAGTARKILRVFIYYLRLLRYAFASHARIFHILWNNKLEIFDRTLLMVYYRLLGKRLVFTVHNVNARKRDGNDTWLNRLTLKIQYRLVDHLFVHTQQMKQELQKDFSVQEDRISVIPFGINSTVPDTALTSAEARQRLGLSGQDKVLLFFGNIAPYKGLEYLIEALVLLTKEESHYRLIVAGRPKNCAPHWEGIQRRIHETGLRPKIVQRIEYIPDADTEIYFKAADVLILPYTHIFQSGVLFLGYNFGLPVIVSDVGSLKEDVIEGTTGYVCRPMDPADLAKSVGRYFSSEMHRNLGRYREEIRHYAHERYSWAKVGKVTETVYRNLIGAHGVKT